MQCSFRSPSTFPCRNTTIGDLLTVSITWRLLARRWSSCFSVILIGSTFLILTGPTFQQWTFLTLSELRRVCIFSVRRVPPILDSNSKVNLTATNLSLSAAETFPRRMSSLNLKIAQGLNMWSRYFGNLVSTTAHIFS